MKFLFERFCFYCNRCRHGVICNYFGDQSMKTCETMCDVCTQRDLVLANLQNLKVKLTIERQWENID